MDWVRNISASAKKRIEMNDCARINIIRNFNSIVVEAGGYENVSFIKKVKNVEGDAITILKYFQKR